ncbi:hypothetical protein SAMN02927903_01900 [Flavobacterium caeni]|uniref:Outer membrane protein beta-barrel domain-containing protein n=2 Tax=Flavobacterium caeni TaxID=490189 RepID=A0A1G5HMV2_9FLAO|nr:hypothetical protein SAMN02927903_01900 [Flavobacterium caeni]
MAVLWACGAMQAQDMRFGVKAGFFASSYDGHRLHRDDRGRNDLYDDYYYLGYDSNASNIGFYAGGLLEFDLVDDFKLQPELTFSVVPGDDGYLAVNVPVLVKYSFFKNFYAQAGPALNYALDGDDDQFSPSFDFGASYDLFENFYTELRVDVGLGGYLGSNVNAGVGYRF